ncbi:MAG: hypothetical protein HWE26_21125 [Alteromonadaceae bacterium]|nr:hypothetical protein [Alteromonadaceae bacterium]
MITPVILCGGSGTRLAPFSDHQHPNVPKAFLGLGSAAALTWPIYKDC